MTSDELADRLINFAARVGKVVDALPDTNGSLQVNLFAVERLPLPIMRKLVRRKVAPTFRTSSAFA